MTTEESMPAAWRTALENGEAASRRHTLSLPRKALRGQHGTRAGTLSGVSLDFSDYREYHPGDDLRNLDWGVYARSDKLTVKLYHEEVAPHLDLLLDASASMNLPDTRKAEAALALAAFFSGAAENAACSRSVWRLEERPVLFIEGKRPPSTWAAFEFAEGAAHRAVAGNWRPSGIRVLISDLMWEVDPRLILRSLSEKAALVIVVQLLAANELTPPVSGRYRLDNVEDQQHFDLRMDETIRQRYVDLLASHQAQWLEACQQTGAVYTRVTDEAFLSDFRLHEFEQQGIL
ncbi:MAG: DUF58 domain-containing protein [Lentisphaeria bacterium]|nr:DUF58 domain-containing protein [Lentisphaeria bacterium]